jgi:hypothetical protein
MVQHTFSMVLYGMTGYTLMSAIVAGLWAIRALRFRQVEVRATSLGADYSRMAQRFRSDSECEECIWIPQS